MALNIAALAAVVETKGIPRAQRSIAQLVTNARRRGLRWTQQRVRQSLEAVEEKGSIRQALLWVGVALAAGFGVVAPPAAPPVADRVNVVRGLLLAADGRRRLRIHPRAEMLIRALDSQMYDPRTEAPDKKHGSDHVIDALGYLCFSAANLLHRPGVGFFGYRI